MSMTEKLKELKEMMTNNMGEVYDDFAKAFGEADKLPTWVYVGKPAMINLLKGHFGPNARFLDFGSASARVEAGVLVPGGVPTSNIFGVEISPEQVEMAKTRIQGATFVVGDVSDPSLLAGWSGTFDVVFSHMVFEHLDDNQLARACANARRLLKSGGMFAFVVTHPDKMTNLDGSLVTTYGAFKTTAPWGGDLLNYRRRIEDTRRTVEEAGFVVGSMEEIQFPAEVPKGLDAEGVKAFNEASAKYRTYPAIRLALSATKA